MTAEALLKNFGIAQFTMCLAVLAVMFYRRTARDFPALVGFVGICAVNELITIPILFFRQALHLPRLFSYTVLFYSDWITSLLELVLLVFIIYGLFAAAMKPFQGLQRIGLIIFRWVGAVSFVVALALAVGPQLFAKGITAGELFSELSTRFQQGIYVLILCLLIFVCFSIRPLGLTFRSHIFGVVLGLGIFSVVQLVQAAWFVTAGAHSVYSPIYLISGVGTNVALLAWLTYFALPDPERKLILLPTTSPFFLWNRISEILGDAPGNVVVGGFKPDMLAAAEVEMLTAATSHEAALERERATQEFELPELQVPAGAMATRSALPRAHGTLALSR